MYTVLQNFTGTTGIKTEIPYITDTYKRCKGTLVP